MEIYKIKLYLDSLRLNHLKSFIETNIYKKIQYRWNNIFTDDQKICILLVIESINRRTNNFLDKELERIIKNQNDWLFDFEGFTSKLNQEIKTYIENVKYLFGSLYITSIYRENEGSHGQNKAVDISYNYNTDIKGGSRLYEIFKDLSENKEGYKSYILVKYNLPIKTIRLGLAVGYNNNQ